MELTKENISYNKKAGEQYIPAYGECDINIPDTKPDSVAVICEDAHVSVASIECAGGKLNLELEADCVVLYRGEDGRTYSVKTKHNFKTAVDCYCGDMDCTIIDEIKKVQIEAIMINSRKLGVRLSVGVDVKYFMREEMDYISDCEDEHIEMHRKSHAVKIHDFCGVDRFGCKNTFEIPIGHPSIAEILKLDNRFICHETKSAGNKVLLKGELIAKMLYMGEDGTINSLENTYPVSEIVALENELDSEMPANCSANIDKVYHITGQDEDGESRLVDIETSIKVIVYQNKIIKIDYITDMFSTKDDLELAECSANFWSLALENEEKVPMNMAMVLTGQPEHIHNVSVINKTLSMQIENGNLNIHGEFEVKASYLTGGELDAVKQMVTLEKNIFIGEHEKVDLDCRPDGIAHNLNLAGELEISFAAIIKMKAEKEEHFTYLEDANPMESCEIKENRPYAMRVYYVQDDDCIWSIAKKYKVKQHDLIEENGEELYAGQRILVSG
ncbi:MAG: DUF3794 domain-containing protein [Oscillospiraceae bacterium]|nr:DUF3794 domain-containing protein [Oscillospiraceae bacterium]